jgi:hypothetical protein
MLPSAALLLASLLSLPSAARAGGLIDWLCHRDCPAPSYSPARYWAPHAAWTYDCLCGPKLSVYAPDRHCEVPATSIIARYPCPPVEPAALWDGNRNVPKRETGPTVGQETATAAPPGAASSAASASKSAGLTK